jgi:peptidoglycan biosynthesis protein MviN/MurJ (putative lipid II flippase)
LSIIFLYPSIGLLGLLYGVILGSIVSFLIQAISLRSVNFSEVRYQFRFHHIRDLVRLAIPRTGTNVTTQLRTIFFTGLATTFGPGSLSSYFFAQRITDAVTQLVQQSITTASLPVLSKDYIEGRNNEYKKIVRKYVILLGLVGAIIATVLNYFQDEVIWLLYDNTLYKDAITYYLRGFLIILPFTMMSGYLSISLYAMKDTKHVFASFFIATLFSVAAGVYFRDHGRIALLFALVTFALFQFLLLSLFYSRKKTTPQIF